MYNIHNVNSKRMKCSPQIVSPPFIDPKKTSKNVKSAFSNVLNRHVRMPYNAIDIATNAIRNVMNKMRPETRFGKAPPNVLIKGLDAGMKRKKCMDFMNAKSNANPRSIWTLR